jgi:hypothetical protein
MSTERDVIVTLRVVIAKDSMSGSRSEVAALVADMLTDSLTGVESEFGWPVKPGESAYIDSVDVQEVRS